MSQRYRNTVLQDAPKGYWRLDERGQWGVLVGASSLAADSSGNNKDATWQQSTAGNDMYQLGLPSLLASRPEGSCAAFAAVPGWSQIGGAAFVQTPSAFGPGGGGFTVECWMLTSKTGQTNACLFGCPTVGAGGTFLLRFTSGVLTFFVWDTGGSFHQVSSNRVVDDGAAHHLVASYDGATLAIYVDGFLDNSSAQSFAIGSNTFALSLGGGQFQNVPNAVASDFAYYDYVLAANRVAAHYSAGVKPAESATTLGGSRLRKSLATLSTTSVVNVSDSDSGVVTSAVLTAGPVTDKSDTDAATTVDAVGSVPAAPAGADSVAMSEGTPSVALSSTDSGTLSDSGAITDAVPPPAPDAETFHVSSTASIAVAISASDSGTVTDAASAATPSVRALADGDTAHVTETASNSSGGHNRTVFGVSLAFGADASSTSIDWTRIDDPQGAR